MKKLIISLLAGAMFAAIGPVRAQIHSPQQRIIEVGGGLLDKATAARVDNAGRWLRLALGKYGSREGVWQVGLLAHLKYYDLPDSGLIGVKQYLIEGTYTPALLRASDRTWYLNPTVGITTGYESVDDARVDPSGDTQFSRFLLGATGGLTGEWNVNHRVALLGYARGNYVGASRVQPFHFYYGIGLRFNYFTQ